MTTATNATNATNANGTTTKATKAKTPNPHAARIRRSMIVAVLYATRRNYTPDAPPVLGPDEAAELGYRLRWSDKGELSILKGSANVPASALKAKIDEWRILRDPAAMGVQIPTASGDKDLLNLDDVATLCGVGSPIPVRI